MKKKTKRRLIRLTVWGTLGAALVTGIVFLVLYLLSGPRKLKPFRPHLDTYLRSPTKGSPAPELFKGKVITVDRKEKTLDAMFTQLPVELRAASPDDVATIVWLVWDEKMVGTYQNGSPAFQGLCKVTVIDKESNRVIAEKEILGEEPPRKINIGSGAGSGKKPVALVIEYLKSLAPASSRKS